MRRSSWPRRPCYSPVMIDETNLTVGQREWWKKLDPKAVEIRLNTSADECKRRAVASGQDYLIPVIDRMAAIPQ